MLCTAIVKVIMWVYRTYINTIIIYSYLFFNFLIELFSNLDSGWNFIALKN